MQVRARFRFIMFSTFLMAMVVFCIFKVFRVKRIVEIGFKKTPRGIVEKVVKRGESLILLRKDRVKDFLKGMIWVKDVKVFRRFPSTLVVRVVEREPMAMYLSNGTLYYVDQWGDVFKRVEDWEDRDLPIVSCFSRSEMKSIVFKILGFFINQKGLEKWRVSQVWKDGLNIYVLLEGGTELIFTREGFQEGLLRFLKVADLLSKQGFHPRVLDLRFKGRVVVRR